jgi:hypothetical protein
MLDVTRARSEGHWRESHDIERDWAHAVSWLVNWAHIYGTTADPPPEPDQRAVAEALAVARAWRPLETLAKGLKSGDIRIARRKGRDVWLENNRRAEIEVLDMMLAQVTLPPDEVSIPSIEPVVDWFEEHRGQATALNAVPTWVHGLMWVRQKARLSAQGVSVPESTDVGGLTLGEARACYAKLLATRELTEMNTYFLQTAVALPWAIKQTHLVRALTRHVKLDAADAFVRLLTYAPGRSPISAPLISTGDMFVIPLELVSETAYERTLLRAASADPSRMGTLGNALGRRSDRWSERLASIPGAQVMQRVLIHGEDGHRIGDLDVVAVDSADRLMLVFETKGPVDAATLGESYKVDALMASGQRQLAAVRDALQNGTAQARWPNGTVIPACPEVQWWVGSAQQLDSRPAVPGTQIGTTSLRLLEHVLPCASLRELQAKLESPPLPTEGVEYRMVEQTVAAHSLVLHFPAIALMDESMPAPPDERRIHRGWT